MRFFENGPAIPDELLHARDEGRVVFFCGAGVSRAKAKLPDFFGLAKKVMETLGVQADSSARNLLEEAYNVEAQTGVAGVIAADRIFGLLERDFSTALIETAVASALRPKLQPNGKPDLTAHRTILDLATTREGLVHVVTTNFDRLFDDCGRDLSSWQRPRLPDPSAAKKIWMASSTFTARLHLIIKGLKAMGLFCLVPSLDRRIFRRVGLLPSFGKSLTGTSLSSSATRRTILLFIIC